MITTDLGCHQHVAIWDLGETWQYKQRDSTAFFGCVMDNGFTYQYHVDALVVPYIYDIINPPGTLQRGTT